MPILAGLAALLLTPGSWSAQSVGASGPSVAAPDPETAEQPPLTERQQRQLQVLRLVLLNPTDEIDADTRRSAAEELIVVRVPQAMAVLSEGLASRHQRVVRAVVAALLACPEPPLELLAPTVETLRTCPPSARQQLGEALARYGPEGLDAVSAAALDRDAPPAERFGPIHALALFRSRVAAESLVELLDRSRQEPPEILAATCTALKKLTGLPNGEDAESWRQWWSEARSQTQEQWLATRVERLNGELAETQAALETQRARNATIERRLHDTYRDLFPSLAYESQLQMLPHLLDDELAAVRRFAVGQVDRLLRDTVTITPAVQDGLARRLDDPLPELRIQAVSLLDELAYEQVAPMIASRLDGGGDPAVQQTFLRILVKRPCLDAIGTLTEMCDHDALGPDAAAALWGLARRLDIPPEHADPLRLTARRLLDRTPARPGMAVSLHGVLAVVGDDADRSRLLEMLDGDVPAMQRAVAQGLAKRGVAAPLLARADDETIYPYAVRTLAETEPGVSTVQTLLRMPPPDAHRSAWRDAVVQAAAPLSAVDLLATDEVLVTLDAADAELRRTLLEPVLVRADDAVDPTARAAATIRLAPILFELGHPLRARELLQPLDASAPAELRPALFRAAVESSAYELAAGLESTPGAWIEVFETLAARQRPHAGEVRDEILRRYGDQLAEEERARFDAAEALLPRAARTNTAAGDDAVERAGDAGS